MNLKDRLMKRREEQLDLGDGTVVYMRELAYSEMSRLRPTDDNQDETDKTDDLFALRVLVACTYDANGERVFSEEDIADLRDGPVGTINKLSMLALRVNGFAQEDGEEDEVDDAGNSQTAPSSEECATPPSATPSPSDGVDGRMKSPDSPQAKCAG